LVPGSLALICPDGIAAPAPERWTSFGLRSKNTAETKIAGTAQSKKSSRRLREDLAQPGSLPLSNQSLVKPVSVSQEK
jgi:hypothetical protein